MTRYYFHLRDGTDHIIDPDGRELPDMEAVSQAALREARSLISHEALEGRIRLNQRIEVEDARKTVVWRVDFKDAVDIVTADG